MVPVGNLSQIFTVPKMTKPTNSMFKSFDQSQIDRGLYQTSVILFLLFCIFLFLFIRWTQSQIIMKSRADVVVL